MASIGREHRVITVPVPVRREAEPVYRPEKPAVVPAAPDPEAPPGPEPVPEPERETAGS